MGFIRKNISITEMQNKFIQEKNISLSKLVQKAINKEIETIKFATKTNKNYEEMKKGKYEEQELKEFLSEVNNW